MKNTLVIILLFCLGCNSSKKTQIHGSKSKGIEYSTTNGNHGVDTMNYIQSEIVANKGKYVNRELSVLLNDLKISVRSYIYGTTFLDMHKVPGITLSFDDSGTSTVKSINHKTSGFLVITWRDPLSMDSVSRIRTKSKGAWLEDEKNYFGNKVIKDLNIVEDNYIDINQLPGRFPKGR